MNAATFDRAQRLLLLLFVFGLVLVLCGGCASPQGTAAVVTTGAAAVGAIVKACEPFLSPEQFAKLSATADAVDGTVGATRAAVGALADAMHQLRTAMHEQHETITAQGAQLQQVPTQAQVFGTGLAAAAGGTGTSRVLSRIKHGK